MCKFCEKILPIDYVEELCDKKSKFPFREKLVLTTECGKIRFYGFNKYHYEDDVCYQNVEVRYCPICGRDLMNENRENCEYLSLETIKSIYEKNVNMAKCKYAVCDYYDGKNVYCITDDLSEAEFECFVKIDHPGNVVYDLEKDEVVWEVKDLGLDDKTLELVTKLKRSWQTNE